MEVTLTSSGDLEGLTAAAAKALRGAQRTVGREVAKAARKAILDDVRVARGSLRFGRSAAGRPYRLGVKTSIDATAVGTTVTVTASPAGFWSIVESGSGPHEIVPRRARVLAFDGVYALHVHHPGTGGHRYWSAAGDALERAVTPVIEETFDDAMEAV